MPKVSILLPTFNEVRNIERMVSDVLDVVKKLEGYKYEILIVDSNSSDGTAEKVTKILRKNPNIHLLSVERGLGIALIKGHQYALEHFKPDTLVQMDADGQVDPEIILKLIAGIEEGNNLVIGSRFVKGGKNMLSLSRRVFSAGASLICRVVMGPFDIKEFTNSARAFTPELFQKINLNKLPWREKTFIIQPAFLHEAVEAGAKYKEIPLVFKNRAEGYSKNKTANYTYDVICYTLDIRLHKLGLDIPLFYLSRRAKTVIKFGMVGITGTLVDFLFYNLFISNFGIRPATAKGISTEIAIINNFLFNNTWTFRHRKTDHNIFKKFGIFNLVSLGGLIIAVLIIKILHTAFGDGYTYLFGVNIAFYNIYFFVTIPIVMTWNFTVNHLVTWRNKNS